MPGRLPHLSTEVAGTVAVVQRPGAVNEEDPGHRGATGSDRERTSKDGEHLPHVALGGGDAITAQWCAPRPGY
jgi:hypothetical protein